MSAEDNPARTIYVVVPGSTAKWCDVARQALSIADSPFRGFIGGGPDVAVVGVSEPPPEAIYVLTVEAVAKDGTRLENQEKKLTEGDLIVFHYDRDAEGRSRDRETVDGCQFRGISARHLSSRMDTFYRRIRFPR